MRVLVLCLVYAAGNTAFAGEFAVLASGARLYVDRHEADAAKVRLYHGSDFLEMNASAVKGFEPDDSPPLPPPPPAAAPTTPEPRELPPPPPTALEPADAPAHRYRPPPQPVRSRMAPRSALSGPPLSPQSPLSLMQSLP